MCRGQGPRATILVVDDDRSVLRVLEELLRAAGHEVRTARDRCEAIQVLGNRSEPVDLLLTDILLADTNGKVLADELTTRWPTLRVVYMSGCTEDEVAVLGLKPGEMKFIRKPFSFGVLCDQVRAALEPDCCRT